MKKNTAALLQIFSTACWGLLAIYTRFNLLAFVIPLVAFGLIRALWIRKGIVTNLLIFVIILTGLIPWGLRHKALTKYFGLSNQSGIVFYHIFIESPQKDATALLPFSTTQRQEFLTEHFVQGNSVNQAEFALQQKLGQVTRENLDKSTIKALKIFSDNLRTFFIFSYYDISDAIVAVVEKTLSPLKLNATFYSTLDQTVRPILFQISRGFKIILALSFFLFPFILKKKSNLFNNTSIVLCLYFASLIAILATGLFTGAAGDRMRMPFNVLNIIFLIQFCAKMNFFNFKKEPLKE